MVRDTLQFAVLEEVGRPLTREHDVARVPGNLVVPGVGVRLAGDQAAGVAAEGVDAGAGVAQFVERLHGRHVVEPGVQPHLTHEDEFAVARLVAEAVELLRDVAGGDEVLAQADTVVRDLEVQVGRQQRHHHVRAGDEVATVVGLRDVEPGRDPVVVAGHLAFGEREVAVGHGHAPVHRLRVLEAVTDQRPRPSGRRR